MATRITFSEDTYQPKVIAFGGSPSIRWYAYLRESDNNLYLRRSVDEVLEAEILVVEPNPPQLNRAESSGISWFDLVRDPVDPEVAWVYWLSDGTLWRMSVTSTPIGEAPTTRQFARIANRWDVQGTVVAGHYRAPGASQPQIPTPTLVLAESAVPGMRDLVIIFPPPLSEIYRPDAVEIYRVPNGGGAVRLPSQPTVPVIGLITLAVPAPPAGEYILWRARGIQRDSPNLKGPFGSAFDFGRAEADVTAAGGYVSGHYRAPVATKVDFSPIKGGTKVDSFNFGDGVGHYRAPVITKVAT